jgi:hypothetical protein
MLNAKGLLKGNHTRAADEELDIGWFDPAVGLVGLQLEPGDSLDWVP